MAEYSILEALRMRYESDYYPFHMPGHKRNMKHSVLEGLYGLDITEIDGFDNLHDPRGILREAMDHTAELYGAKETFYLINGSTAGILSAVHTCLKRNDTIIIARNCHQSVYNAIALLNAKVVFIYPPVLPEWNLAGGIEAAEVERALKENPDAKAVLITSPTYEGITSPIGEIAAIVHRKGIPLIVDEAHGAHFPFSGEFPESALHQGADLVIQSIHKTLPAFTQTALLHLGGELVDPYRLRYFLSVFQSSSPSYLLMAGIEECTRYLEKEGSQLWNSILEETKHLRETMAERKYLRLFTPQDGGEADPLKLVFAPVKGCKRNGLDYTAAHLYQELLEKYHLQFEMVTPGYVLGILTCMDRPEGLRRLEEAFREIDGTLKCAEEAALVENPAVLMSQAAVRVQSIAEAQASPAKQIEIQESEGKTAVDFIKLYPPGIPILVPGEVISREILDTLIECRKQGFSLQGIENDRIRIVDQNQ